MNLISVKIRIYYFPSICSQNFLWYATCVTYQTITKNQKKQNQLFHNHRNCNQLTWANLSNNQICIFLARYKNFFLNTIYDKTRRNSAKCVLCVLSNPLFSRFSFVYDSLKNEWDTIKWRGKDERKAKEIRYILLSVILGLFTRSKKLLTAHRLSTLRVLAASK